MTAAGEDAWQVPTHEIPLWQGRRAKSCIVIPVIDEGTRIGGLLARMQELHLSESSDIIIVDGGSTDGSLELAKIKELGVRALLVKTGPGRLGAQLRCAYAFALKAGYETIITIDGNGKDDPATIPLFIKALTEGVDFAQASRFIAGGRGENTPPLRELAIRLVHAPVLSIASGFRWTDTTQGYRGYSRRLLSDSGLAIFRDVFSSYELLAYVSARAPRLGYRCQEIATARRYPKKHKVPTKISGLKGHAELLHTLFCAALGFYNPKANRQAPAE